MKTSYRETLHVFLVMAVVAVAGQACSDESLDQYRAKKTDQDAAALAPAAQKWSGPVAAASPRPGTSPALGTLTMDLHVNRIPQVSSDTLGTEDRAELEGTVEFNGP